MEDHNDLPFVCRYHCPTSSHRNIIQLVISLLRRESQAAVLPPSSGAARQRNTKQLKRVGGRRTEGSIAYNRAATDTSIQTAK